VHPAAVGARPNQVWAYDFFADRTRDARKFRMPCVINEFTREALAIRVARRLDATHVIEVLADLRLVRGVAEHIRSDQGPEFIATAVKDWMCPSSTENYANETPNRGASLTTRVWRSAAG
jgi:hypothetical protein